jgi:hypothetical protein
MRRRMTVSPSTKRRSSSYRSLGGGDAEPDLESMIIQPGEFGLTATETAGDLQGPSYPLTANACCDGELFGFQADVLGLDRRSDVELRTAGMSHLVDARKVGTEVHVNQFSFAVCDSGWLQVAVDHDAATRVPTRADSQLARA